MSEPAKRDLFAIFKLGAKPAPELPANDDQAWVEEQLDAVAGDQIVLTLSATQIKCFVATTMADVAHTEMQQMLAQRVEAIKQQAAEASTDMQDFYKRITTAKIFHSGSEAEEAFRLYYEAEQALAAFWRDIRFATARWGDHLSVRKGWHVVSQGKKYIL